MDNIIYTELEEGEVVGLYFVFLPLCGREATDGVHYRVEEDGSLLDAPCACNECRAGQSGELERIDWGMGHFLCDGCPDELLWAEKQNFIKAVYSDRWKWYITHWTGISRWRLSCAAPSGLPPLAAAEALVLLELQDMAEPSSDT